MLTRTLTIAGLLVLVAFCLLELVLHRQSSLFREYAAAFLSLQWMVLASFALWGGTFLFLSFGRKDWLLIGLLLITLAWYFLGSTERPGTAILVLVFGVTLGRGASCVLKEHSRGKMKDGKNKLAIHHPPPAILIFLTGLIGLLSLAAWWHLDMSNNYYRGPRWMGLWDNPNTYGMLMGVGVALAIGLRAANQKLEGRKQKWIKRFLWIAIFMLGVGLVMSYSRGAWLGIGIGLLYLAWSYGKLKWRYVLPVAALVAAVLLYHWGSTPDSAPWYVKRADLGRPSAQNRATAWRAGLEIMRDHPWGVGWNKAVSLYGEKYHPPEGGPAALTTNDYLMLGTELGIPALLCFVAYVGLCFRDRRSAVVPTAGYGGVSPPVGTPGGTPAEPADETSALHGDEASRLRIACRAGALVFVVAFWFDGGLFKLPTAALFWVLLELGARPGRQKMDDRSKTA